MKISNDSISPILNNPYEEPKWHYDVTLDGNLDYSKILEGRRPYSAHLIRRPPNLYFLLKIYQGRMQMPNSSTESGRSLKSGENKATPR